MNVWSPTFRFQGKLSDKLKTKEGLTLSYIETIIRSEQNRCSNTFIDIAVGHFALLNFRILTGTTPGYSQSHSITHVAVAVNPYWLSKHFLHIYSKFCWSFCWAFHELTVHLSSGWDSFSGVNSLLWIGCITFIQTIITDLSCQVIPCQLDQLHRLS